MSSLKALIDDRRSENRITSRCSGALGAASAALLALGLLACGDDGSSGGTASSASGGAGHSSGTLSGSGGAMSTGVFSNGAGGTNSSGTSTSTMGVGGGCAGTSVEAQKIPLDMYVMLDQSGSMNDPVSGGGTKWTAVTGALDAFVLQPQAAGLGMGIQFFGYLNGNGNNSSCNAADYANPAINGGVEIATLPGSANAITTAIGMHSPSTKTPTSAALQGAVDHAKAWQIANPTHVVVAVLATDGDPTECDTNLNHIDAIAAAALAGTPPIKTFVIGIGTVNNLNGIAAAGGTTQAFIVDAQNTNTQFLAALNAIQGTSLPCNFIIPPAPMGMTLDYTSLNVQYSPGNGDPPVLIPNVANAAACPTTGNAWYYDNPAAPTQVILCSNACTTVAGDPNGKVHVVLGCETTMIPPN